MINVDLHSIYVLSAMEILSKLARVEVTLSSIVLSDVIATFLIHELPIIHQVLETILRFTYITLPTLLVHLKVSLQLLGLFLSPLFCFVDAFHAFLELPASDMLLALVAISLQLFPPFYVMNSITLLSGWKPAIWLNLGTRHFADQFCSLTSFLGAQVSILKAMCSNFICLQITFALAVFAGLAFLQITFYQCFPSPRCQGKRVIGCVFAGAVAGLQKQAGSISIRT